MAAPMGKSKPFKKGKKRANIRNKANKLKPPDSTDDPAEDSQQKSGLSIKVKGDWKPVEVDYNLFLPDELAEFDADGVEELTDYELVQGFVEDDGDETCTTTEKPELKVSVYNPDKVF